MKKIKILMPILGVSAIASAIAPMISISSCGSKKIITEARFNSSWSLDFVYDNGATSTTKKTEAMFAVSLIKARYKKVSVKLVSVVDPTGADATEDFTILEESSSQTITSGQKLLYFRITVKDDVQEVYSNHGNYVAKVKFTIDKKDYVFNDFKIRVAKATDESDFQITATSTTKVVTGFNTSVKAHWQDCELFVLPQGATGIGNSAFYDSAAEESKIPENMKYLMLDSTFGTQSRLQLIGDSAFQKAGFVDDCYIPNTVTTIGAHAFDGCAFDQNLYIAPFNKNADLKTIGDSAFLGCSFRGDLVIPESNNPITIKANAFKECLFDGTLNISSSVSWFNNYSFGKTTFRQVVFSQKDSTIKLSLSSQCLLRCARLTGSLIIPNRCVLIKARAFDSCDFTTISIPKGVTYNDAASTSGLHFAFNKKLSKLDLSRIDSIDDTLFADPEEESKAAPTNVFQGSGSEITKLTVILNNNLWPHREEVKTKLRSKGITVPVISFKLA